MEKDLAAQASLHEQPGLLAGVVRLAGPRDDPAWAGPRPPAPSATAAPQNGSAAQAGWQAGRSNQGRSSLPPHIPLGAPAIDEGAQRQQGQDRQEDPQRKENQDGR